MENKETTPEQAWVNLSEGGVEPTFKKVSETTNSNELNLVASLLKKKSKLRKQLADVGFLKNDKKAQHYNYLGINNMKLTFNKLLTENNLEFHSNILGHNKYTLKTSNGATLNAMEVNVQFSLCDIDTGYCESCVYLGDASDSLDKESQKAITYALRSYLQNEFMFASSDEEEVETSFENKMTIIKNNMPANEEMKKKIFINDTIKAWVQKTFNMNEKNINYETAEKIIQLMESKKQKKAQEKTEKVEEYEEFKE